MNKEKDMLNEIVVWDRNGTIVWKWNKEEDKDADTIIQITYRAKVSIIWFYKNKGERMLGNHYKHVEFRGCSVIAKYAERKDENAD